MMDAQPQSRNKIAVVTGASRGIGAATARLLGRQGYSVAVNYHSDLAAAEQVADAIAASGSKAIVVQGDMGKEADVLRLFAAVDKELGPVSALVNNAAVNPRHGSGAVEEMPWEVVEAVFNVNVLGIFAACREAMKRMKAVGGGIVNVSSEAGRFGGNRMAHYAASKAALNMFTVAFAREAAAVNVRVNAVSPGVIDTDAHNGATPERLAALKASLPMARMGSADEVAETIAWLLSDAASYVSGSLISVAGAR